MQLHKSIKKRGSSILSINIDESFSMEELLYVASRSKSISFLEERLFNIYEWTHGGKTKSYTEMAKFNVVPLNLMPLLKRLGYCDNNCNWIPNNQPTKADAVYIAVKNRNYTAKLKNTNT
jgi:hypothetical protein